MKHDHEALKVLGGGEYAFVAEPQTATTTLHKSKSVARSTRRWKDQGAHRRKGGEKASRNVTYYIHVLIVKTISHSS